jgi:TetR/AcrR family transcriptional repressor of nem operon
MAINQREALLEAGVRIVHERGFGATGVRDVAMAAGVPHGSFTNHFRSKEAFEVLVLDRYAERIDGIMEETLGNTALDPVERLKSYFDRIAAAAADAQWQLGCLVGDLASEIAAHGDVLRGRACEVLSQQSARFEEIIRLLRPDDTGAADLGMFLLAAWHGTLLRMKTEQGPAALDSFRRTVDTFLNAVPSLHANRESVQPSGGRV